VPVPKKANPFEQKKDLWGGEVADDVELDSKKLMEALRNEDKRLKEGGGEGEEGDGGDEVGLYKLKNPVDPQLESAWFQPLTLHAISCDLLISNFAFSNSTCTATPSGSASTTSTTRWR
jgi:hypothetical protein